MSMDYRHVLQGRVDKDIVLDSEEGTHEGAGDAWRLGADDIKIEEEDETGAMRAGDYRLYESFRSHYVSDTGSEETGIAILEPTEPRSRSS